MKWSHYNTLFEVPKLGYYLHNALSNKLFRLSGQYYSHMLSIRDHNADPSLYFDRGFLRILSENSVLVDKSGVYDALLLQKYNRDRLNYDSSKISLTICPTLNCNFGCTYCYEGNKSCSKPMTSKVAGLIPEFIQKHQGARQLSIEWFGGEPLLEFEMICHITDIVMKMDIDFVWAGMVTNGYFLEEDVICHLNGLNIQSIQVTIDGPENIHDKNRPLLSGEGTFRKIMKNLDALAESNYNGECVIRINLDHNNYHYFPEIESEMQKRYKGKKFYVYAGCIMNETHSSCLSHNDWVNLIIKNYRDNAGLSIGDIYPTLEYRNICMATMQNGYVIGPKGELYKCWEDVGKEKYIIGNIASKELVENQELLALYAVGSDAYSDEKCQKCDIMPLCWGGCANKKIRNNYYGEKDIVYCPSYKQNLIKLLEEYIRIYSNNEKCLQIIGRQNKENINHDYQIISH